MRSDINVEATSEVLLCITQGGGRQGCEHTQMHTGGGEAGREKKGRKGTSNWTYSLESFYNQLNPLLRATPSLPEHRP